MASEIEICNRALQHLGQARINSLDEPVRSARECKFSYPIARDALLEAHSWNFALTTATFASEGAGRFLLPSDFLTMHKVGAPAWRQEGKHLIAEQAGALTLTYVQRVEDPNEMPALFREALGYRLAVALLPIFAPSVNQAQFLEQKAMKAVQDARWSDGKNAGPGIYEVQDSLEARHGGGEW